MPVLMRHPQVTGLGSEVSFRVPSRILRVPAYCSGSKQTILVTFSVSFSVFSIEIFVFSIKIFIFSIEIFVFSIKTFIFSIEIFIFFIEILVFSIEIFIFSIEIFAFSIETFAFSIETFAFFSDFVVRVKGIFILAGRFSFAIWWSGYGFDAPASKGLKI